MKLFAMAFVLALNSVVFAEEAKDYSVFAAVTQSLSVNTQFDRCTAWSRNQNACEQYAICEWNEGRCMGFSAFCKVSSSRDECYSNTDCRWIESSCQSR